MANDIIIGRDYLDRIKFGNDGLLFVGKHYITMGQVTSLSNKLLIDFVRPHIILVSGKRGSGKCVVAGSKIQLFDGSLVNIEKLKDDKRMMFSLNEKLKITVSEKDGFFERKVNNILEIKLRSGRELKLTPEHPLLTIHGWECTKDLKIGSRIATPRVIPIFGNEALEDHEIKLLAYLITEGCLRKNIDFTNSDEEIIEDFEISAKTYDQSLEIKKRGKFRYVLSIPRWNNKVTNLDHIIKDPITGRFKKGSKINIEKRPIRIFLERHLLYNKLSVEKEIPEIITKLKKEKLSLFINRLFSCDGSIYKITRGAWEVSYASSSKKLITVLQNLLLRFGILSKLKDKKIKNKERLFCSFELVINGENVVKFIEEIGFFGKKKLKENLALEYFKNTTRNPNLDTIPKEIWDLYTPRNWAYIGRAVGYKYPKAMRERKMYSPSRQTLLSIAKVERNDTLELLAESDIFWDEVVSMKLIDGLFNVYDISIPRLHNFVVNDIIVHNSTTMGVLAEEMIQLPISVSKNISVIIFDTMGIFWTMKFPNNRDEELLKEWNLKPQNFDVNILAPSGYYPEYKKSGIPVDAPFSLRISDLTSDDWCHVFGIEPMSNIGILIERSINKLKLTTYDIDAIINMINKDKKSDEDSKNAAENRFIAAQSWGLFDKFGTQIKDIVIQGKVSIIDLSAYTHISGSSNIKALAIGLISKKLLNERIKARKLEEFREIENSSRFFTEENHEQKEVPLVWLFIDEVQEFIGKNKITPATNPLIQILREGRQPGISLVLATQQPGELSNDVLTQTDIIISHRLTSKSDVEALNSISQIYLTEDIKNHLKDLPSSKGSAIILDDNSERIYPIKIRPRISWHGGDTPSAIIIRKKALVNLGL